MEIKILKPTAEGTLTYNCGTEYTDGLTWSDAGKKVMNRALRSNKNVKVSAGSITGTTIKAADKAPKITKIKDKAQVAFLKTLDTAAGDHPDELKMSDVNWKYLVRSVLRGKNIMMTGPAGCGKTFAAQTVAKTIGRELHYFNLGATQDPRSTLIGNVHFDKGTGTVFCESPFIKAIQTENAVILLDELSRANPEAWNILMTVLDPGQRYIRLDESSDSQTISVASGVCFIATANIGNEYTSTRVMDKALMDRFVTIEMSMLNQFDEFDLISKRFPHADKDTIKAITEIAETTRKECKSDTARITAAISTRTTLEMASLAYDGFSLLEAAEVTIYPQYDDAGGVDSERTFVKQIVQKYCQDDTPEDLFNTDQETDPGTAQS